MVRALDYSGLVFHTNKARSRIMAMATLEEGIATFNGGNGCGLMPGLLKVAL